MPPAHLAVTTMQQALQGLKLAKSKVEGKGSCWHLSVLNHVARLIDNARKLDLRGREIDFRVRHLVARKLLQAAVEGETCAFTDGGSKAINLLDSLLYVPVGTGHGGVNGFDPTGEEGGSWAGCLCQAVLSA